jgi:hypothetical protein
MDIIMLAAAIPLFYLFNRELSFKAIGYTRNALLKIENKVRSYVIRS